LSHDSLEDVCVIWREGLRRVWDLPPNAHSVLLPPLCGLLPLKDELAGRYSQFINKCIISECDIVKFVVCHGNLFPECILILEEMLFIALLVLVLLVLVLNLRISAKQLIIDKQLIRSYVEAEYSDNLIHCVFLLLVVCWVQLSLAVFVFL